MSEQVQERWNRYFLDRNVEARNELITHYSHLIQLHAKRLAGKLSIQVSVEEIASAAFDGLMAAVETYDPDRKVKFETYASKRIVGAVLDWLRSVDPQSRAVRQFERKHGTAMVLASCDAGQRATPGEIANQMGISTEEYERNVRRLRRGKSIPLSRLASGSHKHASHDAATANIPHANQPAPSAQIEREMVRTYICRGLCATERRVLLLYYYEDLTMAETGAVLGLSESRVSQIHRQVLEKLRSRFASSQIRCAIA